MTHPFQMPDRVAMRETVKEKLGKGWTYTEIGELVGISRSAVAGMASRFGVKKGRPIPKMGAPRPNVVKPRRASVATIAPVVAPIVIPKPTGPGVHLLDLAHQHCRFPTARWMSCGEPKSDGAYCAYHAQLCYAPNVRSAAPSSFSLHRPSSRAGRAVLGMTV